LRHNCIHIHFAEAFCYLSTAVGMAVAMGIGIDVDFTRTRHISRHHSQTTISTKEKVVLEKKEECFSQTTVWSVKARYRNS